MIRSPAEVYAAAAGITRTVPKWQGEEGPRWRITVSPGSVQIGTRDYAALNRSSERRIEAALRQNTSMTILERPTAPRGHVTDWSQKSRARMVRRLCTLDYTPLFTGDRTPALVTLTMPHDWETVAGTAEDFKKIVDRFRAAYRSVWGDIIRGVWKMEFQYRQACARNGCHDPRAPHLHILTVVPEGTTKRGVAFPEWLSKAWAQAVAHPDPEQRRLHELAGTGIDYEETLRYGDAKRIAVYFTKHGSFASKDYQNDMPEAWKVAQAGGARFWGYWGLRPAEGVQETDEATAVYIARHLRKLNDAQAYVRDQSVWRVERDAAESLERKTGNWVADPDDETSIISATGCG